MSGDFPNDIQKIIDFFALLPGVGPRSAFRMAMHLLRMKDPVLSDFASTVSTLKENIHYCEQCHNLTDSDTCTICLDDNRDKSNLLVVEDVLDLVAFERIGDYRGLYHVLGGVISPMRGIGPDELFVRDMFPRVKGLLEQVEKLEIIIATNPNLEGEATAMFIKNELGNLENCSITRIARGIPTGAEIDYADTSTLSQALQRRDEY